MSNDNTKRQNEMKSAGDILRGDGSNDGYRLETSAGASITSGPTKDPSVPGGQYVSVTDTDGNKQTIVYNKDGSVNKKV